MYNFLFSCITAACLVTFVDVCKRVVTGSPAEKSTIMQVVHWIPGAIKAVARAVALVFDPRLAQGSFGYITHVTFHDTHLPALDSPADLWGVLEALETRKEFEGTVEKLNRLDDTMRDFASSYLPFYRVVAEITPDTVNIINLTAMEIESLGEADEPIYDVSFPDSCLNFKPVIVDAVESASLHLEFTGLDLSDSDDDNGSNGSQASVNSRPSRSGTETSVAATDEIRSQTSSQSEALSIDVTDILKPWARAIHLRGVQAVIPFILRDIKNMETEFHQLLVETSITSLRLEMRFVSLDKQIYVLQYH